MLRTWGTRNLALWLRQRSTILGLPDPPDRKSGAAPVEIGLIDWSRGFPGVAMVSWHGEEWRALDYGDKFPLGPELCEQFRKPADTLETPQCLLKSVAAAVLHAQDGQLHAHGQVLSAAQILRTSHWWSATEAAVAFGDCPPWSPEENVLRVFIHDVLEADHEKDFHSLAAFPHESHGDLALYVWRVSRGGALTLESFVWADFQTNRAHPKVAHALVHKGHMRLLVPPPGNVHPLAVASTGRRPSRSPTRNPLLRLGVHPAPIRFQRAHHSRRCLGEMPALQSQFGHPHRGQPSRSSRQRP